MKSLSTVATKEDILAHISDLKIHAINLITHKLTHNDAKYMEPRELKTLTDTALSIEDSVRSTVSEGSQARTIQRLLDKYGHSKPYETYEAPKHTYIDVEEA
jgi:hypothetical protein